MDKQLSMIKKYFKNQDTIAYVHENEIILKAVEEMKNKSSRRTLPLPTPVFDMLVEAKAQQEFYRKMFKSGYSRKYDDYVCVNQLGELLKPSYVTAHFPILLEQLGMRKIRFHDLRHSCASVLLAGGVPMKQIREWLGHSDMSTTANIYSHLDAVTKADTGAAMSKALG